MLPETWFSKDDEYFVIFELGYIKDNKYKFNVQFYFNGFVQWNLLNFITSKINIAIY